MTEDLRALMRSELSEERPPPLGDLIATAMVDGRRITRRRRFAMASVSAAVLGVVAAGTVVAWPSNGDVQQPVPPAGQPQAAMSPSVVPESSTPSPIPPATVSEVPEKAETWTVRLQGKRASDKQLKATPEAVLELLTRLLPKGKTSNYAANDDDGLFAQVYLDTGNGPGMIRVWLKPYQDKTIKPGTAKIETFGLTDNCAQSTVVYASYPTGGHLEMDIATCLNNEKRPARAPLTFDQAVDIMSDARWGMVMDADIVVSGEERFAKVPAEAK